ncbi:uncharacterized protein LOC8282739 [Ricinus communis]|uniref:Structure-specific endonuclease subunit SLX1 homolog n=1 Tax=Ricinus communis TaxID=3988 RepID=B9RVE6_RICCO|nr:uncharacterized protein LOC8282739 [Ricinus communis]EEF44647.1 nuclease, putative [Ricinus communis]|eukprot:XP_002517715.1 uncharacterized protein LOC8282739 [Ricinus communis]
MRKRTAKGGGAERQSSAQEDEEEGKGFYACYLLTSLCPRFKGHTYIGFTVNPRRRIRQHNGEIRSGAFRTKKRRPWEMVFCIYGFPTNVSALQFEWAWQHPMESLAVRQAAATFKSFSGVANKIKLAYTMLNLSAWQSLNITVNYFSTKYSILSAACPSLPEHMKIQVCPVVELPCYKETGESSLECQDAEDGFDDKENYENTTSESGAVKGKTVEFQSQSLDKFPDFNRGEEIAFEGQDSNSNKDEEYNEVSQKNGTLDQIRTDAFGQISSDNSHTDDWTCEKFGSCEDYSTRHPSLKNTSADYPPAPKVDCARPFGFPTSNSLVRTASSLCTGFPISETSNGDELMLINNSVSDLGSRNGKILTGKDDKDKPIPQEIEVIDLLSPSPECRIMSSRKKRRFLTVCPQIIDLT